MVFGDVLDRKDAFPEYENMYLIFPKNGKFSKGVNPSFWSKIEHSLLFVFIENRPRNDVWGCSR